MAIPLPAKGEDLRALGGPPPRQIVADLGEAAVDMVRREKLAEVRERAASQAEERLLDLLLPPPRSPEPAEAGEPSRESFRATRDKLRGQLRAGALESRLVEVEVP